MFGKLSKIKYFTCIIYVKVSFVILTHSFTVKLYGWHMRGQAFQRWLVGLPVWLHGMVPLTLAPATWWGQQARRPCHSLCWQLCPAWEHALCWVETRLQGSGPASGKQGLDKKPKSSSQWCWGKQPQRTCDLTRHLWLGSAGTLSRLTPLPGHLTTPLLRYQGWHSFLLGVLRWVSLFYSFFFARCLYNMHNSVSPR